MLCAITSVGRFTSFMTFAIVKVLPEPVTPSNTCVRMPSLTPSASFSIACGWSPVGLNFECSLNSISSAVYERLFFIVQL